jgi:hypothetical protein
VPKPEEISTVVENVNSFSLREKARMREYKSGDDPVDPLSPAHSRWERKLSIQQRFIFLDQDQDSEFMTGDVDGCQ